MHIKKRCVNVIHAMLLVAIACCLPTASALTKDIPVISDRIVLVGPETSGACAVTYPREDGELQAVAESLVAYVLSMVPDEELILSNSGEVVNAEYEIAILSPDPSFAAAYALKLDGKRLTL